MSKNFKKYASEEYVNKKIAQSDWKQNDETAIDYIKNKTHYDTRVAEIVTYTFDGNFDAWTGEKVDLNGNGAMYYLKLSDDVPSLTDFVGCT